MAKTTFVSVLLLCAAVLVPGAAHASDLKFGAEPLAVSENGKITDAGKKAAVTEINSEPGEEEWTIHVYAQIDNGGPGPLYLEFFGKLPDGKPYLTYRHEYGGYNGEKYISFEVELTGNLGFNKNKSYSVKLLQSSPKGKDIVFATQKLTLGYTEPPAEEEDDDDGGEEETESKGGDGDEPGDAQDAADSVAEGPPPVEPKKKGCSVHPEPTGIGLAILLLAAGFVVGRRRR